jgi:magnesium chelatase family protein
VNNLPRLPAAVSLAHDGGLFLDEFPKLSRSALEPARQAVSMLGLSARACEKVPRVAWTIADLAGREHVGATYLSEAIQYRRLDRQS